MEELDLEIIEINSLDVVDPDRAVADGGGCGGACGAGCLWLG